MSLLSLAGTVTRVRALAIGATAAAAVAAGALYYGVQLGREWERGDRAQIDVAALGKQIEAFAGALDKIALDNQAAQQALSDITRSTLDDLDRKRIIADRAARALDTALDARPDLADVRVGADLLREWNAGNAGDDTGGATGAAEPDTGGGSKPDDAVPGAAASNRRPVAEPAAQPRANLGAVSPMRRPRRWAGVCGARARADRGGSDRAGGQGHERQQ